MYSRPPPDLQHKVSHDYGPERPRPSWESQYQHPLARTYHQPPYHHHPPPQPNLPPQPENMEPESSDSDVSVGGGDDYRFASPLTAPMPLPRPASKHALELPDAVRGRLDELQRVEDHNAKKNGLLKAKRARKDEKIRRRREAQDKKWNAILETRQRRDARIEARRRREDAAFSQFNHELDDEESNLRLRLKRLKRGLPPDESPIPGGRSMSSSSMSPPGPALSTLPPPPKRHQVGLPGQPDAINPSQSRPSPQSNLAMPVKANLPNPAPPYSFARDYSSSYPRPYHNSTYSTTPVNASPTVPTNAPGHSSHLSTDRSSFGQAGRPASPLSRPVPSTVPSNQSPVTPAVNTHPPRQVYDTRPPPTTTASGFASVNAPPPPSASGFATINARSAGTPPASHAPLSRPTNDIDGNGTPGQQINNAIENNRFQAYSSAPDSAATTPTANNSSTKRTPSTTHPYQMSEAFANRHHHCERVDPLNRGIWTSHGIGGTADNPTGPPVEMYLRCNHDGCARIDWRTVHGLQCHIVKNHEQPKGTIGSLEKALERYGVPVAEVEEFEREHGRGSAGTMADPKNLKMKLKTKIQDFSRKGTPGSYGIDPDARPAGYRPSPAATDDSPMSDGIKQSPDTASTNGFHHGSSIEQIGRQSAPQTASTSPANAFTAVRPHWMGVTTPSPMPTKVEPEPKSLQGDFSMPPAPKAASKATPSYFSMPPAPKAAAPSESSMPPASKAAPSVAPLQNALPLTLPTPLSTVTVGPPSFESPAATAVAPPLPTAAIEHQPPAVVASAVSALSVSPIAPTETKPDEGKPDAPPSAIHEPVASKTTDGDVEMTGMQEPSLEEKKGNETNGAADTEKKIEMEKPAPPATKPDDRSETIEVGSSVPKDNALPLTRRANMQSPVIATRSLAATTPKSARQLNRRSSAARKSVDIDSEAGKIVANSEDGEKDEKEGKDEKSEKIEPRRSSRRGTKN